jgi:hypothetical protein
MEENLFAMIADIENSLAQIKLLESFKHPI